MAFSTGNCKQSSSQAVSFGCCELRAKSHSPSFAAVIGATSNCPASLPQMMGKLYTPLGSKGWRIQRTITPEVLCGTLAALGLPWEAACGVLVGFWVFVGFEESFWGDCGEEWVVGGD